MDTPRKGDFVTRRSHGSDMLFEVVKVEGPERVCLKGVITRLMADSPASDLIAVPKGHVAAAKSELEREWALHQAAHAQH